MINVNSIEEAINMIRETHSEELENYHNNAEKELRDRIEYIHNQRANAEKVIPMTEDKILENAKRSVHRFWFVKNVTINGVQYDAQIDSLTNEITFSPF